MERLIRSFIRVRELHKGLSRGQTMSEYALILAGVAVVAFAAYASMGNAINSMVQWNTIDKDLLNAL